MRRVPRQPMSARVSLTWINVGVGDQSLTVTALGRPEWSSNGTPIPLMIFCVAGPSPTAC
jgi:hypothetical protein